MTATEKVLMRKDGATLITAIVVATVFGQFLVTVAYSLSAEMMGKNIGQGIGPSAKDQYLMPLIALALELIAIELFIWLVIGIRALVYPKTSKKRK
jgi:hypothetical protein